MEMAQAVVPHDGASWIDSLAKVLANSESLRKIKAQIQTIDNDKY